MTFHYAYNQDPPGAVIGAITVSPLGSERRPLTGHEPVVRPIARGSGHMDVAFTFSQDQLALLQGLSVCFTARDQTFGCSETGYGPG